MECKIIHYVGKILRLLFRSSIYFYKVFICFQHFMSEYAALNNYIWFYFKKLDRRNATRNFNSHPILLHHNHVENFYGFKSQRNISLISNNQLHVSSGKISIYHYPLRWLVLATTSLIILMRWILRKLNRLDANIIVDLIT